MPNGFPAFRYDPTTAPRYLVVTAKTAKTSPDTASSSAASSYAASTHTASSQQSDDTAMISKHQSPTERDAPKKSHSKPKEVFKKLLR